MSDYTIYSPAIIQLPRQSSKAVPSHSPLQSKRLSSKVNPASPPKIKKVSKFIKTVVLYRPNMVSPTLQRCFSSDTKVKLVMEEASILQNHVFMNIRPVHITERVSLKGLIKFAHEFHAFWYTY